MKTCTKLQLFVSQGYKLECNKQIGENKLTSWFSPVKFFTSMVFYVLSNASMTEVSIGFHSYGTYHITILQPCDTDL